VGAAGIGLALVLGEGMISAVGDIQISDKGQKKRSVTIVLLGGTREPQTLRGKLIDDSCSLADGLEPYTRVRVLATTATYNIDAKTFVVITFHELERVTQSPVRPEVAA